MGSKEKKLTQDSVIPANPTWFGKSTHWLLMLGIVILSYLTYAPGFSDEKEFTKTSRPKTSAEIDSLFEIDENDLKEIRNVFHNQRN